MDIFSQVKDQFFIILGALSEGVEIVDAQGTIVYINPAVERIGNLTQDMRIGKNIFEVSPNGSLAKVLRTGQPVLGNISTIEDSGVEIISNGMPIIVEGELVGGITLFHDLVQYGEMAKTIEKNRQMINSLQEGIQQLAAAKYYLKDICGVSPAIQSCRSVASRAAESDISVLITGESGTGKELIAHGIHQASKRAGKPFIKLNCAAIPDTLLESELFGYEKGAFTGAMQRKLGKFELAGGGTLFLDEVGDMSLLAQAKILRSLQEKEIERIGGQNAIKVDVRIVAATNRDLKKAIEEGAFRKDLYYRLNIARIHIPPLRERREDIKPLVKALLEKQMTRYRKHCVLSDGALTVLQEYHWPGNVRELENVLERAVMMTEQQVIGAEAFVYLLKDQEEQQVEGASAGSGARSADDPMTFTIARREQEYLKATLDLYGWDTRGKRLAARHLGISLSALYKKLKRYQIGTKMPRE